MRFIPTKLPGAWLIEPDRLEDERGYFARTWCEKEFADHEIAMRVVQCNTSVNRKAGTLRGMHYQAPPHGEAKVVRCVRGAMYDVALDLRPDSPTFKQWAAVELTGSNGRMFFIPEGCAHGLQTLADDTEVFYLMSTSHHPDSARGVRWNDPAFGIQWPDCESRIISPRDSGFEDFPC